MTITLLLESQQEARLVAAAQAKGISTAVLVREALDSVLADPSPEERPRKTEARPIWEVMLENMKDVSPEELEELPTDGASQHDHYLYGHAKREP